MSPLRTLPAALVVAFGLVACGGGSSPDNTASTQSAGVLVDDLVIDATVFCDSDGNGVQDTGEATATTDASGAYTFSPACNSQVASVPGTGYDQTTLKAPKGMFRAKAGSRVTSPITTMQIASGLSDTAFSAVLTKLGLSGIGNGGNFDPTDDRHGKGPTAAALIKILNEIGEVVESAGGDPKVAFAAAVAALVTQAQALPDGIDLFAGTTQTDAALLALIKAVATAGFTANTGATWTATAQANAADLLGEGLKELVKRIKAKTRYADLRDEFSDGSISGIISGIDDLEDETKVGDARNECRGHDFGNRQYVSAAGDSFTLVGPGFEGGQRSYTLAELDTGINLSTMTLGSLTRLELPLQATPLALPRQGARIAVALEVQEVGGTRLLQVLIDKLKLTRNPNTGRVGVSVTSGSELYFYARSDSGVEIGTGRNAFEAIDGAMLASTQSGAALDLQVLAERMRGKFPGQSGLIDKLLTATGQYRVKLVVSETDLRHANGSRFSVARVAVRTPGSERIAERLNGTAVLGHLTF